MRASEIRVGELYAVNGKEIAHAQVRVLSRVSYRRSHPRDISFLCTVMEGQVYVGWGKTDDGGLDMYYAGPGEQVTIPARDFLRPWAEELERRVTRDRTRADIATTMTEMDDALNLLGLPDTLVSLVQTPDGPMAVAVLGIEELRQIILSVTKS